MTDHAELPTEELRRQIFAALVEAQDQGERVVRSRVDVAERFGVTRQVVERIEREGLAGQWPPL
jgi:hypothetical protein